MKHIGSLAPSGTCTTIMNLIFNGLPGVAGVGDTFSILNRKDCFPFCGECGPQKPCPIFTRKLLEGLRENQSNFYKKIAEAAGQPVLYTQDSPWSQYEMKGIPDVLVFYYRDIYAWVASDAHWEVHGRRFSVELPDATPIADIEPIVRSLKRWCAWYRINLQWAEDHSIRFTTFNTDHFIDYPEVDLSHLCEFLGVKYGSQALRWWENEHHKIGGRFNVGRGKQSRFGNTLQRDQSWKRYLTVAAYEHIKNDEEWHQVWSRLVCLNAIQT